MRPLARLGALLLLSTPLLGCGRADPCAKALLDVERGYYLAQGEPATVELSLTPDACWELRQPALKLTGPDGAQVPFDVDRNVVRFTPVARGPYRLEAEAYGLHDAAEVFDLYAAPQQPARRAYAASCEQVARDERGRYLCLSHGDLLFADTGELIATRVRSFATAPTGLWVLQSVRSDGSDIEGTLVFLSWDSAKYAVQSTTPVDVERFRQVFSESSGNAFLSDRDVAVRLRAEGSGIMAQRLAVDNGVFLFSASRAWVAHPTLPAGPLRLLGKSFEDGSTLAPPFSLEEGRWLVARHTDDAYLASMNEPAALWHVRASDQDVVVLSRSEPLELSAARFRGNNADNPIGLPYHGRHSGGCVLTREQGERLEFEVFVGTPGLHCWQADPAFIYEKSLVDGRGVIWERL